MAFRLWPLLFLCVISPSCNNISKPIDCGFPNITAHVCAQRDCCYTKLFKDIPSNCIFPGNGVSIKKVHVMSFFPIVFLATWKSFFEVIQSNHFDAGYVNFTISLLNRYFDEFLPRAASIGAELKLNTKNKTSPSLKWMTQSWIISLYHQKSFLVFFLLLCCFVVFFKMPNFRI